MEDVLIKAICEDNPDFSQDNEYPNEEIVDKELSSGERIIHSAVRKGSKKVVEWLLQHGCDITIPLGRNRSSPLFLAIVNEQTDIVKLLISGGADTRRTTISGDTPASVAVYYNQIETLQYLISFGCSVDARDDRGQFPLFIAVVYGNLEMFEILTAAGADVNQQIQIPDCDDHSPVGVFFKNLLPSKICCAGDTITHVALRGRHTNQMTSNNHSAILESLLKLQNLDLSLANSEGETMLDVAIANGGSFRKIKMLLKAGCKMNLRSSIQACIDPRKPVLPILRLLDRYTSLDVNATTDKDPCSPLILATAYEMSEVVIWLLRHGADVNTSTKAVCNCNHLPYEIIEHAGRNAPGLTALHISMCSRRKAKGYDMAVNLCQYGSDANARTSNGETPMHFALTIFAQSCDDSLTEKCLLLLLTSGADPDIPDTQNICPLQLLTHGYALKWKRYMFWMFLDSAAYLSRCPAFSPSHPDFNEIKQRLFSIGVDESVRESLVKNPRTLKFLSRRSVRRACRGRHVCQKDSLSVLPNALQQYVFMNQMIMPDIDRDLRRYSRNLLQNLPSH